jgi:outer membrane lipoprotein
MLAVDPLVDYVQVRQNPTAHLGKTMLLGGLLVDTQVNREGTDLEVILFNLDRWGRPLDPDASGGRFIARTDRFLDPELFRPGLHVTLTGKVSGEEVRPLKGNDYHYPVFSVGELHLWQSPSRIYGYPPYYPWAPYYDPFWGSYGYGYNPYWDNRPVWRYR